MKELRRLAEESQRWEAAGCPVTDPHDTYPQELFHAAANPAAILSLLDRLEKAEKDAERYQWLKKADSTQITSTFIQRDIDAAIDRAMEASK